MHIPPTRPDQRGASLVEYVFLVGLIAMVCIVAVQFFGDSVSGDLEDSASIVSVAE